MASISLTDIVLNSDIESTVVNSIFSEIEDFLNGSTANADITITGTMTADQFQTSVDGSSIGSGAYIMGAGDDSGLYWDGTDVVLEVTSALTNSPQYLTFKHTTSGTPAAGIGTGIKSIVETSAGNNETGALLEFVTTDVTSTSEDFDLVIKLMAAGSAAAEKFRVSSAGLVTTTSINLSSSTTVSSILDEDDMSSDSATALATQQSIKSYVDSQVGSVDTWQEVMDNGNTYYVATNDGNAQMRIGASDAEELHIQTIYDSGAQTLDYVLFQTDAASGTADKGEYRFNVDGTEICQINDSGINLVSGLGFYINDVEILNATTLYLDNGPTDIRIGGADSGVTSVDGISTSLVDSTLTYSCNLFQAQHISNANRANTLLQLHSNETNSSSLLFKATSGSTADSPTDTVMELYTVSGDLKLSLGNIDLAAADAGIDFTGQTGEAAGVASSLLDHYEEGTWTPSFSRNSSAPSSVTYTSQVGEYTRIGDVVYFSLRVNVSAYSGGTGGGHFTLPIAPRSITNLRGSAAVTAVSGWDLSSGYTWVTAEIVQDSAQTRVYTEQAGDNVSQGDLAPATAGFNVNISGHYFV